MKQLIAILFFFIITLPSLASSILLQDYSYVCFSQDAVFLDKSSMIKTLKCINTIGQERIEKLTYYNDGTWSAILFTYDVEIAIFGKTSDLRTTT